MHAYKLPVIRACGVRVKHLEVWVEKMGKIIITNIIRVKDNEAGNSFHILILIYISYCICIEMLGKCIKRA